MSGLHGGSLPLASAASRPIAGVRRLVTDSRQAEARSGLPPVEGGDATHLILTETVDDGGPAGGSSVLSLVGAVTTVLAPDQAG